MSKLAARAIVTLVAVTISSAFFHFAAAGSLAYSQCFFVSLGLYLIANCAGSLSTGTIICVVDSEALDRIKGMSNE